MEVLTSACSIACLDACTTRDDDAACVCVCAVLERHRRRKQTNAPTADVLPAENCARAFKSSSTSHFTHTRARPPPLTTTTTPLFRSAVYPLARIFLEPSHLLTALFDARDPPNFLPFSPVLSLFENVYTPI